MSEHDTPAETGRSTPGSTPDSDTGTTAPVAAFSLRAAARVAGVSVSTLRRHRAALEAAGATISAEGWSVPVTALEATGLMRPAEATSAPETAPRTPEVAGEPDALREALERIRELEAETLRQRHRAELAEAVAGERGAALEAERMALRMLTAGPSTAATTSPETATQAAPGTLEHREPEKPGDGHTAPRPSWWRRTFG